MRVRSAFLFALCIAAPCGVTAGSGEQTIQLPFVGVPKGCFEMGRSDSLAVPFSDGWTQLGYRGTQGFDEVPRHRVCLDAFEIGRFEVRADEWRRVMGEAPPKGEGEQPASGVTWSQAKAFVARLEALSGDAHYRLPTEAEWEYACRAGARRDFAPSLYDRGETTALAWYNDPSRLGERLFAAKPVGLRKANPWGLHDMLGNVWEWVEDGYLADGYRRHSLFNPRIAGPAGGERVIRGGSYRSEFAHMRCGNRGRYATGQSLDQIGFRVVRQRTGGRAK